MSINILMNNTQNLLKVQQILDRIIILNNTINNYNKRQNIKAKNRELQIYKMGQYSLIKQM